MVASQDSFESIARRFGVDEESVLRANKITNSSRIYPLKPILVPLKKETCRVNPLLYFCSDADDSAEADRKKPPRSVLIAIGVGSGIALLVILLALYKAHQLLNRRRRKLNKEKFFKQNGGILLQQKLRDMEKKVKIFSKEQLHRATDNFNQDRLLGRGGYGSVYRGNLQDGSTVAVKRSNQIDQKWIEQFINEVAVLSQINHRNIVKLLGCCLETEFPLLVYEFVPNKTLSHHIHHHSSEIPSSSLSWESRLRIASEVAGAISYMHSAASIPIFHRDIKSSNVLLDDNCSAKVSDFGTSRFVPSDQSHLTTKVQGTLGYIDPEYFRSSKFTEKSDVYSFGVLMVELLTAKQPFSFAEAEGKNLLDCFISMEKDAQLVQILDSLVVREEKIEEVYSVAKVAVRCLRLNGKRRPTMKQVFLELERLRKSHDFLEFVEEDQSITMDSLHNSISSDEEFTDDMSLQIDIDEK